MAKLGKVFSYFSIRKSSISDNKQGFGHKLAKLESFLFSYVCTVIKGRFVLNCGTNLTLPLENELKGRKLS